MFINCWICTKPVPKVFSDVHHERPQAAGGGPQDTMGLCTACHQALHRVAGLLRGNKGSEADDAAKMLYPSIKTRSRLFELAKTVNEWMVLKKDGKLEMNDLIPLTIVLPAEVRLALTQMAAEVRKGKRSMGVATFVSKIVCGAVYKRYPQLQNPQ